MMNEPCYTCNLIQTNFSYHKVKVATNSNANIIINLTHCRKQLISFSIAFRPLSNIGTDKSAA